MNLKLSLSLFGLVATLIGFALVAENILLGFYVGIAANVAWIYWGKISSGDFPFYVLQYGLMLINLKGIIL